MKNKNEVVWQAIIGLKSKTVKTVRRTKVVVAVTFRGASLKANRMLKPNERLIGLNALEEADA